MQQRAQSFLTDTLVMVSPDHIRSNEETAATNSFQQTRFQESEEVMRSRALQEFQRAVECLRSWGVRVLSLSSAYQGCSPDAVFPNNWFSSHAVGPGQTHLVLYPMMSAQRRRERELISSLQHEVQQAGIQVVEVTDLSFYEKSGEYLEGTGSLVLDRKRKLTHVGLSSRAYPRPLQDFGKRLSYRAHSFATQVYHTNVVMSVGPVSEGDCCVVCLAAIPNAGERCAFQEYLRRTYPSVIELQLEQMENFCGNILWVENQEGRPLIIMSERAKEHFSAQQKKILKSKGDLVALKIPTIESLGGGSARCMLAEIFYKI